MDHPTSDARPALGTYMITLILTMIGLAVLFWVLEAYVGVEAPTGISSVLPTLAAAMVTGDRYAKTHRAKPSPAAAWRFSWLVTGIQIALSFLIFAVLLAVDPSLQAIFAEAAVGAVVLIVVLFLSVVILLVNRFFLAQGAKAQLTQMAKRGG